MMNWIKCFRKETQDQHVGNSMHSLWLSDRCAKAEFIKDQQCNSKGQCYNSIYMSTLLFVL